VALKAGLTEYEAEEVLQETMLSVSKNIPDFEYDPAKGKFKGWLLKLTHWRIKDQFRKRRRQPLPNQDTNSKTGRTSTVARIPDPRGCDLEAIWDQEWQQTVFRTAGERVKKAVNARHYQIFDLYVVKEWPPQKVAKALGVNTGQVFVAKHRILSLVRKEMSRLEAEGL
jgi:RNA polymerase sigma-70 factor (ECF subfamily)